jgi:beta-N-acetylhexosaminidase
LRGEPGALARQAIAAGCDLVLHCNGDPTETAALLEGCPALSAMAQSRLAEARARMEGQLRPLDPVALVAARDAHLAAAA